MLKKIRSSKAVHFLLAIFLFIFIIFSKTILSKFNIVKDVKFSIKEVALDVNKYCLENYENLGGKENCYSKEFVDLAIKYGPEYSFKILYKLQEIDEDSKGCHFIAHGIGSGLYKKDPSKWRDLIQTLPTVCSYGAVHGVIEKYVASLPGKSLTREIIPTICGNDPRADCNHIVGHLLLVEAEANIDGALSLCSVFNDPTQKDYCFTGVFMEYQTADNLIIHNLAPNSWRDWPSRLGEIEKICRSYGGKEAEACWEEIVHVALVKFDNNAQKIFDLCSSSQIKEGAKKCRRHSIGIMAASKNFYLPSLKYICSIRQNDDPDFESDCYSSLIASTLSSVPSPKVLKEAVMFCSDVQHQFQNSCYLTLGSFRVFSPLSREVFKEACDLSPKEFYDICMGAAVGKEPYTYNRKD